MKKPKLIPYIYISKSDWEELDRDLREEIRETEIEYLELSRRLKRLYRKADVL